MFAIILKMAPIIDTHVHLWDIKRMDYPWLEEAPAINRSYLIAGYQQATQGLPVEKMVVVQGECLPGQYLEEVTFIREQAVIDDRIRGIVAYAPVEDPHQMEEALQALTKIPLVKGVRRMYDHDPSLCCTPSFIAGLQRLPAFDLSFDISIMPHAMKETIRMIEKCPETRFVLDHLGKPGIAGGKLNDFRRDIDLLAAFPNTTAKISGLVTEADREKWTAGDLAPYIEYALHRFGFDRLAFGSDWPVVLQAASYDTWTRTLMHILEGCREEEITKLFYTNAEKIYHL